MVQYKGARQRDGEEKMLPFSFMQGSACIAKAKGKGDSKA